LFHRASFRDRWRCRNTFKSVEPWPGALRLHFNHVNGGLVLKGDKLEEFSIAGEGGEWVWAEASIDGDTIVASSPVLPKRKAACFCARQAIPEATLHNAPVSPLSPPPRTGGPIADKS
jgi:sialate O-acetylesterase